MLAANSCRFLHSTRLIVFGSSVAPVIGFTGHLIWQTRIDPGQSAHVLRSWTSIGESLNGCIQAESLIQGRYQFEIRVQGGWIPANVVAFRDAKPARLFTPVLRSCADGFSRLRLALLAIPLHRPLQPVQEIDFRVVSQRFARC